MLECAPRYYAPSRSIHCREVVSHGILGLAVFTFVFFVPQLVRLMDLVVRHSGGMWTVALLFLCTIPPGLGFTLPMGVLVGVLIGLGRLSADSEIVALHASGIGLRRLLLPIGLVALVAAGGTLLTTFWLSPVLFAPPDAFSRSCFPPRPLLPSSPAYSTSAFRSSYYTCKMWKLQPRAGVEFFWRRRPARPRASSPNPVTDPNSPR